MQRYLCVDQGAQRSLERLSLQMYICTVVGRAVRLHGLKRSRVRCAGDSAHKGPAGWVRVLG